jgi:hypothetical protein
MIKIVDGSYVDENYMTKLAQLPRFTADLMVMGEKKRKEFVSLIDKNDRIYWADVITGTLYDAETGRCGSSHMWIPAQQVEATQPTEIKEDV